MTLKTMTATLHGSDSSSIAPAEWLQRSLLPAKRGSTFSLTVRHARRGSQQR
jgi:hypothetical protein